MSINKNHWKDQFVRLPNQSDFHEQVRTIFRTNSWFKHMSCYQEVPVIDLVPSYPYATHRFDWYIDELATVLELHGAQHYKPTAFGAMSYEQKQKAFAESVKRDTSKQLAAEENDYYYRVLSYKDIPRLTADSLKALLLKR